MADQKLSGTGVCSAVKKAAGLACGLALAALPACVGDVNGNNPPPVNHPYFPIASGVHAVDCGTCHTSSLDGGGFVQFTCLSCHVTDSGVTAHELDSTDPLHLGIQDGGYTYDSASCYRCHNPPTHLNFDHSGITGPPGAECRTCHFVGAEFFALNGTAATPLLPDGGVHQPAIGTSDCGSCHGIASWVTDGGWPAGLVQDPMWNLTVNGLIPSWSASTITSFTTLAQTLPSSMDHASLQFPTAATTSCTNCHSNPGSLYPGNLHGSLDNLGLSQPSGCSDCHAAARPYGFVGATATNPPRTPPSGEMSHYAVAWVDGGSTSTLLVPADCSICHQTPGGRSVATWSNNGNRDAGPTPVVYHPALTAAGKPQPASCIDCHANTRPEITLTSATPAALPAGLAFDHTNIAAKADCITCHDQPGVSWTGGRFHQTGSATPSTCLPCHAQERPTSTAGWSSGYASSPFDYTLNSQNVGHGGDQDCAVCHTGPGTGGAWGGTEKWVGGHFPHGAGTLAGTTCIACHTTQRPDLNGILPSQLPGSFDHSVNGTGDCQGCHQATVTAGHYVHYSPIPGSDWQGGLGYPGSNLVSAPNQFWKVNEITLIRTGSLITGMSSAPATLNNAMLHTSVDVPAAIRPSPPTTHCGFCHTSDTGPYANGKYHPALFDAGIPEPGWGCLDCHAQMRPAGIVQLDAGNGGALQSMDHSAAFKAAVVIDGGSVTSVSQMECASCHHSPGTTWADGAFHANIAGAVPADCSVCHYPLMVDFARSDVTNGISYKMQHQSAVLTTQNCQTCHTQALGRATQSPASTLWNPGALHAHVAAQPTACNECHLVSEPAANASTQGSVVYAFNNGGGTSTNGGQWMNHGSTFVAGTDCVTCHAADAVANPTAFAKSDTFHPKVSNPTTCTNCHGLNNGVTGAGGDGDHNNLPSGLTNSSTFTTASKDTTTGVPNNTPDQIDHKDINVTSHQCDFCHTQAGTTWAQASFHSSFNAANPLILNATTGRCSNCHVNVKPHAGFSTDHSTFTATSTEDCATCHSWPGTGTATSPNWLGAAGTPSVINVGGFTIPAPPASGSATQTGISNLPHPTVPTGTACTACHQSAAGGKNAQGYDHASSLITSNCNSCHEAGSDDLNTPYNGQAAQASGLGDTRPWQMNPVQPLYGGKCQGHSLSVPNHFYPADCSGCHNTPGGITVTTTGNTYLNQGSGSGMWQFPHDKSKMRNLVNTAGGQSVCNVCHGPCPGD